MNIENSHPFTLAGKHAVVTGGASGIGLATAHAFADAGAHVTILDIAADQASQAAATLSLPGHGLACDVTDPASVEQAFTEAGRLDLLVNSAGISHIGTLLSTTSDDLDRLYRVNVRGTFLSMQAAVRRMQQIGGGAIVNMASIAATAGLPDRFAYSMTKGAVLAMTLSAARDYLADGIRCNCISPARVHTPFVDGYLARTYPGREAEMMQTLEKAQPIGRMGRPEEIAWLALYLCSNAAAFITGVDYPIDGGYFNLR
ncbi:MAG: SDR family NAD(P)-dependent oxidoreductase [Acidobacteriaceae bacterium]